MAHEALWQFLMCLNNIVVTLCVQVRTLAIQFCIFFCPTVCNVTATGTEVTLRTWITCIGIFARLNGLFKRFLWSSFLGFYGPPCMLHLKLSHRKVWQHCPDCHCFPKFEFLFFKSKHFFGRHWSLHVISYQVTVKWRKKKNILNAPVVCFL